MHTSSIYYLEIYSSSPTFKCALFTDALDLEKAATRSPQNQSKTFKGLNVTQVYLLTYKTTDIVTCDTFCVCTQEWKRKLSRAKTNFR